MANRRPLVLVNGLISQLPSGDILEAELSERDVVVVTNAESTAITIGQPVYIADGSYGPGEVLLAQANTAEHSEVLGLVKDDSIAGAADGNVLTDGYLTSSDWTAVTGSVSLTVGAVYFLDPLTPGMLTETLPDQFTDFGQYIARIGRAVTAETLEISIEPPIGL